MSLVTISCAFASEADIPVYLNRVKVDFPDQKPYVDENGRTLVPVRFISEALGANVKWDDIKKTVTITKGQNIVILTIDKKIIIVNGKEKAMDTEAIVTDQGRTMVPVRFISEALGQTIGWDQDTCSVYIGEGAEFFNNSSTDTLGNWTLYDPLPEYEDNETIYRSGIVYGNGQFILRTTNQRLFTSFDGTNWKYVKKMDENFRSDLHCVNGKFVSWCNNDIFMTSDDGINFYENMKNINNDIIWTSDDGITWSENKPNISGEYNLRSLGRNSMLDFAYGNGKYIGVGMVEWNDSITLASGQPYSVSRKAPLIYMSTDCKNWQVINLENLVKIEPKKDLNEGIKNIVFGNGCFIANSDNSIYKSWDGENWYKVPLNCWFRDITCGNGVFMAVGQIDWVGDYVWKSDDGVNWSKKSIDDNIVTRWNHITYGGGIFVLTEAMGADDVI